MLIVTRKRDAAQVRVICEALEGTVAKVVWTVTPRRLANYKVSADGDYRITEAGRFWLDHHRRKRMRCGHYTVSSDRAEARCPTCEAAFVRIAPICARTDGRKSHIWSAEVDGVKTCKLCGMQRKGGFGYTAQWRVDSNSEWQRFYRRVRRQA